eukprot:6214831-Pleurochrysis_carterae.AAC.4
MTARADRKRLCRRAMRGRAPRQREAGAQLRASVKEARLCTSPETTAERGLAKSLAIGCATTAVHANRGSRVGVARRWRPDGSSGGCEAEAGERYSGVGGCGDEESASNGDAAATGGGSNEAVVPSGGGARMAPWPKPSARQCATAMRCARATSAAPFAACEKEEGFGRARVALVVAATDDKHCKAEELSDGGARVPPLLRLSTLGKVTGGTRRGGTTTLVTLGWRSGAAVRA